MYIHYRRGRARDMISWRCAWRGTAACPMKPSLQPALNTNKVLSYEWYNHVALETAAFDARSRYHICVGVTSMFL